MKAVSSATLRGARTDDEPPSSYGAVDRSIKTGVPFWNGTGLVLVGLVGPAINERPRRFRNGKATRPRIQPKCRNLRSPRGCRTAVRGTSRGCAGSFAEPLAGNVEKSEAPPSLWERLETRLHIDFDRFFAGMDLHANRPVAKVDLVASSVLSSNDDMRHYRLALRAQSKGSRMPRRLAIIQGHPDPCGNRFCHALADAYATGASAAGHEINRIEVARIDFPVLRTQDDFETGQIPEMLVPARDAIVAAQHLLIIFPLWHGTMPALLKAFIEQVMRPGVALEYRKEGFPKGLLAGRSARLVVTMGMPALIYRWYFQAHGVRGLERSVLRFSGMKPIRETLLGTVQGVNERRRQRWLDQMKESGKRLV